MSNEKIMKYKSEQIQKMQSLQQTNYTPINIFYTGDVVNVYYLFKGKRNADETYNKYLTGVVTKGNTHRHSVGKKGVEDKPFTTVKPTDYVVIGSMIDACNRMSIKVFVNHPGVRIELIRRATRKNGSLVRGAGRANRSKDFMNEDNSLKRLKQMFKNAIPC